MLIKKVVNISLSVLLFSGFFSCTEIIDMEFSIDFERLVVDAQIVDVDTSQYVKLSKINIDNVDEIVSPVSSASVVVNDGTSDLIFEEDGDEKGLYLAPEGFKGEPGENYMLNISNTNVIGEDGTDIYKASGTMAYPIFLDSVTASYVNNPTMGLIGTIINCWAEEPEGDNYYLFKNRRNGVLISDTLYEYTQSYNFLSPINGRFAQFYADEKEDEYIVTGDTLSLEISNIDEAFYDYLNSAQSEYYGSNPLFGGPSANVVSNVSNGAVGVFRVYSVSTGTLIMGAVNREDD
jgi:hypothetical protein